MRREPVRSVGEQTSLWTWKVRAGQRLVLRLSTAGAGGDLRHLLREVSPAGFLLAPRAMEEPLQVRELLRELGALLPARHPPVMLVDPEDLAALGGTRWPAPPLWGSAADLGLTRRAARAWATEAEALGFHLLLAPVADVARGGGRGRPAFGGTAAQVADQVEAWIGGAAAAGIATAPGGFPGAGAAAPSADPRVPALLEQDPDELRETDLAPFRAALGVGVDVIRAGHVRVLAWDEEYPCGTSSSVLRRELRGGLGFRGLVLEEHLLASPPGTPDAPCGADPDPEPDSQADPVSLYRALSAGVDLLVCEARLEAAGGTWEHLVRLQEASPELDPALEDSDRRLLAFRRRWLGARSGSEGSGGDPGALERIGSRAHQGLAREIRRRAAEA